MRDDNGAVIHLSPVSTITSHHMEQEARRDAQQRPPTRCTSTWRSRPRSRRATYGCTTATSTGGRVPCRRPAANGGVEAHAKPGSRKLLRAMRPRIRFLLQGIEPGLETIATYAGGKLADALLSQLLRPAIKRDYDVDLSGDRDPETQKQLAELHEDLEKVTAELTEIKSRLSGLEAGLAETKYNQIIQGLPLEQRSTTSTTSSPSSRRRRRPRSGSHSRRRPLRTSEGMSRSKLQDALDKFKRAFTGAGPLQDATDGCLRRHREDEG